MHMHQHASERFMVEMNVKGIICEAILQFQIVTAAVMLRRMATTIDVSLIAMKINLHSNDCPSGEAASRTTMT